MQIYQVEEVGAYIRELFELDENLADLWVTGEITNLSKSPSGHYYFSLRDDASQLRGVMFCGNAARSAGAPRAGDAVVAHGKIDYYGPQGSLQLIVDLLYPAGVGEAYLRFEALRLRLEQEGLFAVERKRELPPLPPPHRSGHVRGRCRPPRRVDHPGAALSAGRGHAVAHHRPG